MPAHAFEALLKVVHSLFDEDPKPPLHVGEVMSSWTYLAVLEETVALEQMAIHSTEDKELLDFLEKTMNGASSQAARLKEFLRKEGVSLPPASGPKPKSEPASVPLGAKMTDNEIANSVSAKIVLSITMCASSATQSVRNDVGLMFIEFQTEAMKHGALLKSIMKKRGWLKMPPYYHPPGKPNS